MGFSANQELESPSPSFVRQKGQELLGQPFSGRVTFEAALDAVNELVFAQKSRYLSKVEILVMKGVWDDIGYEEIANNSPYSHNYLQRTVAPNLWNTLSETIGNGKRVGKKRLRCFLEQVAKKYYIQSRFSVHSSSQTPSVSTEKQTFLVNNLVPVIGDQPPDVSSFFGRAKELTDLKNLTLKQQCVAIIGVAGIGKSALAAKLLASVSVQSQPSFDCLIWKSVSHAPLLEDLVSDLIRLIQPKDSLPEYTQAKISALLKLLQSRRCLLVLDADDAKEALFQRHSLEQQREYEFFFRRLIEERHQSCLILTSRVLPRELKALVDNKRSIQSLKLEGLDSVAAMQLLSSYGFTNQEKCHELIKTYRGSPSELEAVAHQIYRFFGSTGVFFENQTTLISAQLQETLNHMFAQVLSEIQRQIMIYLAEGTDSNSTFIGFNQILSHLNQNWSTSVPTSDLIAALGELEKYSLVEINKHPTNQKVSFTLQPTTKKYILTDPLGLVRRSTSSHQSVGDRPHHACNSRTEVQPIH